MVEPFQRIGPRGLHLVSFRRDGALGDGRARGRALILAAYVQMARVPICLLMLLPVCAAKFCNSALQDCQHERERCEANLEKVPAAEWRRISDELAECQQHLKEFEASSQQTKPLFEDPPRTAALAENVAIERSE